MYQILNKKSFKGFTLVELIIVITILAILGTIAYISFQGYTKDARDSSRMSDIKQLYNGISIYKTQTEKTPIPDNYVNILSGTTTISYQGYAGANVLRLLKITGGKDPGTKDYYIYSTDVNQKKGQLMTFMETSDKDVQLLGRLKDLKEELIKTKLIEQAQATSTGYYQDKKIYVYGDKIGILTDSNKVPLQETVSNTGIDITTLTGNITTYFGGNVYSGGLSTSTGLTLINQINGAINGKLPCNEETYNGYTITSLQDSQTGTFTKSTLPSNGTQTGILNISCSNGTLNYSTKVETLSSIVCNSGYLLSGGSCIPTSPLVNCSGTSVIYTDLGGGHGKCIFPYIGGSQTLTANYNGSIDILAWGGGGGGSYGILSNQNLHSGNSGTPGNASGLPVGYSTIGYGGLGGNFGGNGLVVISW